MQKLPSLKVLVVEDETIISFLVEDMLVELGCREVKHAANVAQALALIAESAPDLALLDVNLGSELVYPVAERLAASRIPFAFATGYGRKGIDAVWSGKPVVQKPFGLSALQRALAAALAQ